MEPQDLTAYRETLKFDKKQMGLRLGVSGAAIGLWEKGTNRIPIIVVKLITALKLINDYQEDSARRIKAMIEGDPPKPQRDFKNGDKATVQKSYKVSICLAATWYNCGKCGGSVKPGKLHGVSHSSRHYCLKCCE